MEVFVWNMAISYQLLFVILSSAIFFSLRERSFKFYALYNIFLVIYVVSRNDGFYYDFEDFMSGIVGRANAEIFVYVFFFYIQIVFYSFYSHFALYFLDLDQHSEVFFERVVFVVKILGLAMFITGLYSYFTLDFALPMTAFTFIYLPSLLYMFVATTSKAIKYSGSHKRFFLVGISFFVLFGLVAFAGSRIEALGIHNPINFFYVGIILETIFFSLGLAHKLKLLNDEKMRVRREIIRSKHRQQLSKLHGLLEGEERERKRIAEELHDGIAGDLAAIQYNLQALKKNSHHPADEMLLSELTEIISRACVQLREISHNLSLSLFNDKGLIAAIENFCVQNEHLHGIKFSVKHYGEPLHLSKPVETHLYRIIQELVTNIVKHSQAKNAEVEISNYFPQLSISVKDDGTGFSQNGTSGIGLSNINSRARFINAVIKKEDAQPGSKFLIEMHLGKAALS